MSSPGVPAKPSLPRPRAKAAAAVALLLALAGASWVATRRPLAVAGPRPNDGYTRLAGVVHVHTTRSDGGGTPEEVARAAKQAGLAFVAITDHNNLDAKPIEGYRDGVLVLVGTEISTTAGHLVGLGIPDPVYRFSGDALDALDDVRALGGVAFAAHPESARSDFRFTGDELPGAWGFELLNGDSQWREAGVAALASTAAIYLANPRYALLQSVTPPAAALARWDKLLSARDVAGIVGADAHSRVPFGKRWSVRFPSYTSLFELVRNVVLLERPLSGDAAADVRAVVEALGRGRSYVGLHALADAGGFFFTAEDGKSRATMGDTIAPSVSLRLRAGGALPDGARLRLLKDGRLLAQNDGPLDAAAGGAGVYRVEAYLPGSQLPWVLSNPIYVFGAEPAAARAGRAAWPESLVPPSAALVIDDFETTPSFGPEFDPSSQMDTPIVVSGGGSPRDVSPSGRPGPSRVARLAFRLGEPGPGRPHTWCALVDRRRRDLGGRQGIVLSLKGDGVYRIWFQVRDDNPASADEGQEAWFTSLKTTTEWRGVAVPFARLRSIDPKSDGRLDLDRVRALVFVLDKGAVKPGTAGTIWIDDVGVY